MESIELSLPTSRMVRGYEIKRLPLGGFLQAVKLLQELPMQLGEALYPGKTLDELLRELKGMKQADVQTLLLRAFTVLPEKLMPLFSKLSGISESKLRNDPAIGLDGLMEMVLAWAEVNQLENFMAGAWRLAERLRAQNTASSGFNG